MRGQRVMLDRDLARLYEVPTKASNQTIQRNADRFPADFAFQLIREDVANLRSQIVTSSSEGDGCSLRGICLPEAAALRRARLLEPRDYT